MSVDELREKLAELDVPLPGHAHHERDIDLGNGVEEEAESADTMEHDVPAQSTELNEEQSPLQLATLLRSRLLKCHQEEQERRRCLLTYMERFQIPAVMMLPLTPGASGLGADPGPTVRVHLVPGHEQS
jgi:hypothetical protein